MNEHADPDEAAPGRIVDQPTWLISRAYARANSLLNAAFEEHGGGLRKYHYRLLAGLEQHGPTSQAQLGRGTKVDRSDVVAVLNDLEQQRLVKRAVDPANRTRNIVSITRAGSKRLRELDAVVAAVQEQLLAPLSVPERDRFLDLLRRVIEG